MKYLEVFNLILWKFLKKIGLSPKLISKTIGIKKISNTDINLLELMKSDNKQSISPYKATDIWTKVGNMFEDWFYWEGIKNVEEQKMNSWFSSPFPRDPKLLRYACWMLYQNVKSRDKLGILAKVVAGSNVESGFSFKFEENIISWDILISLDTLYSISEFNNSILTEAVVVVDIGAGWGRIGYVLKIANPKAKYIILDLPQGLIVSSTYLPKRLPDELFLNYEESKKVNSFNKENLKGYGGAFLGTSSLDKFEDNSIDFLINVASFQEMTLDQVNLYFEKIDKKLKVVFYTQQLWKSDTHNYNFGEIPGYTSFPFRAHWDKIILKNATWSDLYFETMYKVN